jgi:hypothetical protein
MSQRIRIYTHEVIIHAQMHAIEKVLNRTINYTLTLNTATTRSNIEFDAEMTEIESIKSNLGYPVMIQQGNNWLLST